MTIWSLMTYTEYVGPSLHLLSRRLPTLYTSCSTQMQEDSEAGGRAGLCSGAAHGVLPLPGCCTVSLALLLLSSAPMGRSAAVESVPPSPSPAPPPPQEPASGRLAPPVLNQHVASAARTIRKMVQNTLGRQTQPLEGFHAEGGNLGESQSDMITKTTFTLEITTSAGKPTRKVHGATVLVMGRPMSGTSARCPSVQQVGSSC